MTAWFGLGRKRALSLVVGSFKRRGSNYPNCFVPTATYCRSSESELVEKLKKNAKNLRSSERDTLTVFVTLPPSLEADQIRSPDGCPEDVSGSKTANRIKKLKKRVKTKKKSYDDSSSERDVKDNSQAVGPKKKSERKNNADTANNGPESKTVKKYRRRKKDVEESNEAIKDSLLGSFVPFEGVPVDDSVGNGLHNSGFSIDRQDLPEGRFYRLKSSADSFSFPSVTTILNDTIEGSSYYRLLKWKLKLTGEHGAKGFNAIRQNTLDSGHNFHKNLEDRLLRLQSSQKEALGEYIQPKLAWNSKTSTATGKLTSKKVIVKAEVEEGVSSSDPLQSITQNDVTEKAGIEVDCDPTGYSNESLADSIQVVDDAGLELEEQDYSSTVASKNEDEDDASILSQTSSHPGYMESIQHVLDDLGKIKALETSVAHLQLGYVGTFDCLAEYKGTLCLIDWKTSNKPKPSLADCYDYPLQAVAYAGAVNQDPHLNLKVLNVLIVVAYSSGEPAHTHLVNYDLCRKYWLKWLQRLQKYQTQFSEDLSEIVS